MRRSKSPVNDAEYKKTKQRRSSVCEQLSRVGVFFAVGLAILGHIFWNLSIHTTRSKVKDQRKAIRKAESFSSHASLHHCTIDRISSLEFTAELFKRKYYLQKPVIITFSNNQTSWIFDKRKWTVDYLRKKYAAYTVLVGDGVEIIRRGGVPYDATNFEDYLNSLQLNASTDQRYLYSKEFFNSISHFNSEFSMHQYLGIESKDYEKYLFLGGRNSGIGFHKHADSWNGLIFGKKRWLIYPSTEAGCVWYGYSPSLWIKNIMPLLNFSQLPFDCMQEAGEIIYIPEGFYHATVNYDISIAVGLQRKFPVTKTEEFYYTVNSAVPSKLPSLFSKAQKFYPNNTEWQHKRAVYLLNTRKYKQSGIILTELVERYPLFLLAILDLAEQRAKYEMKLLEGQALYKRALELNPRLWETYVRYGDFLLNYFGDRADAVRILEKGSEIKEHEILLWQFLKTAHDLLGNKTASQTASLKISELSLIPDTIVDF